MRTRDDIITSALRKCGVLGDGETASSAMINTGAAAINPLISAMAADGMVIWKMEKLVIPFSTFTSTAPVTVGPAQTVVTTSAPLKCIGAWRQRSSDENTTPMEVITRYEHLDTPNPATTGAPIQAYFQPLKTTGLLQVWPLPDTYWQTDGDLILDVHTQFTQTTTGTDVLDFPDNWEETLIYQLAQRLAPEYGVPIQERQLLTADSERFYKKALDFSNEEGSIYMIPTMRRY